MADVTSAKDDRPTATVKSVKVTVEILEAITEATGAVRVTELARRLDMTKARVSRHLHTLTVLGLVDRAPEGEGFVFGRKLLKFGRAAVYRSNIVQIAQPFLSQLRNTTGHTAFLTTPTRGGAMVVAAAVNEFEPGVMIHPGTVLSLPGSPAARLIYFFEGQRPIPPRVEENLRLYGVDYEANARGSGLGGIAAPIFEPDGLIASTVGIILSSSLLMPAPKVSLLEDVKAVARRIQDLYAEGAMSPLMPAPDDGLTPPAGRPKRTRNVGR